jgi:ABC-type multidrug transport system fused ATPase/permease subunit
VLESKDNVTIEMRYNYVNGVKRDEYKYVAVTSNVPIYNTQNTIVDKSETYEMVKVVENKIKKQSKLIDVFYVFDFFRYIAPVYLFILFGIYFTVGLKVALCILIPLLLVGLLIGFIINKVGNHLLDKIDEKSKAELLYKDFNSYFDEEYISAVINTPN